MDELKPCPFCGSKNVIMKRYHGLFGVECDSCYRPSWGYWKTKEQAIKAWNRRQG